MFIYQCAALTWNHDATIGFNAGGTVFENHPLSGADALEVACLNYPETVWSNVIYQLTPKGIVCQFNFYLYDFRLADLNQLN